MDCYDLENIVVTCSSCGSLYFWNSDNYSLMAKYNINNTSFTNVKCSPVSNLLAVGSENGVIRIYDTENIKYSSDSESNVELINKYKDFRKSLISSNNNEEKEINIDDNEDNNGEYPSKNDNISDINFKELFILLRNKISDYPIKHVSFK